MKKGLIGIVILALVVLLSGPALAIAFESIDVTVDATLEWIIFNETGLMPEATGEDPDLVLPELTISVGAWKASTDGDYIEYAAEMGSITLKNSADYGIFGLGGSIAEAQGIVLATEMASLSVDVVYTTGSEYGFGLGYSVKKGITATEAKTVEVEVVDEETWAWIDDDENVETPPIWGHPIKTVEEEVEEEVAKEETVVGLGVKYNSTGAYGVEVVVPLAPVTLTGQYAIGSAYLVKGEYALAVGSVSVCYQKGLDDRTIIAAVDDVAEWVDDVWTFIPGSDAVMGDPLTRITATLAGFPITDATALKLEVVSQDLADVDYIEGLAIVGEIATTLAENVILTLNVKSAGDALTYFGKIGVAF